MKISDSFITLFTHHTVTWMNRSLIVFFADLNLPQLTERDRDFLEAPIKIEEISQAIRSMPPNKSPGRDGLPADFYTTFEDIISPMLLEVYSDAFKAGTLPQSMHTTVISFIHKKGKR